jgi:hypothetical protein
LWFADSALASRLPSRRRRRRLLLHQHLVRLPEITVIENLPIMFARISSALSGSSWCPDANSSPRSAPVSEARRRCNSYRLHTR